MLTCVRYLTTETELNRADLDSFTQALETAGADTTSIKYVRTARQLTRMTMISSAPTQPAQNTASQLFGGFSGLSSRVTDKFKEAGLGANIGGLLEGVKNFLPANKDLTLTKITHGPCKCVIKRHPEDRKLPLLRPPVCKRSRYPTSSKSSSQSARHADRYRSYIRTAPTSILGGYCLLRRRW
jgi:hypothetical protein